jgi:hypothetical protein
MRGLFRAHQRCACPRQRQRQRQRRSTTSSSSVQGADQSFRKTLVLSNIFPDPSASAAGVRTQALLDGLAQSSSVHLATSVSSDDKKQEEPRQKSASSPSLKSAAVSAAAARTTIIEDLARRDISWSWLPPNRSQQLDEFVQQHSKTTVDKIIFDRFYIEEAYSFAVKECYPEAALILDMQDMHSLRGGREKIVKDWDKKNYAGEDPFQVLEAVMSHIPSIVDDSTSKQQQQQQKPLLLRELGSIHRSDLTLVCSPYELELLESTYGISSSKLCLAPFFVAPSQIRQIIESSTSTTIGKNPASFVFCGGFKHAPNVDAVRLLLRDIWPRIRTNLPTASLHIHGAYCPAEFRNAHSPSEKGVHVHGYTPSLEHVFGASPGSILLAPLRFGAGIKGKIIDAWTWGIPVVTTPVGSEGMTPDNTSFGGGIAWSVEDFVNMATELATDANVYIDHAKRGQDLLRRLQDQRQNWGRVESSITTTVDDLYARRKTDYTRALLWHHSARSTEYFSRWIELKETMHETSKGSSQ